MKGQIPDRPGQRVDSAGGAFPWLPRVGGNVVARARRERRCLVVRLALRRLPATWWCRVRGGHVFERYAGEWPPAPGRYADYMCARCHLCISIGHPDDA